MSSQILVLTTDDAFASMIDKAGKTYGWVSHTTVIGHEEDLPATVATWPETSAVLVVGPGWDPGKLVELIRSSIEAEMHPGRIVVAYGHVSPATADELRSLGVENLLNLPVKTDYLWSVIRRASTTGENRNGHVITVFSTKGGVGTTFIATNLAVLMSQWAQRRVALVDLDLHFGDVGATLGLMADKSLYEFSQNSHGNDIAELTAYLTNWDELNVMLAPPRPELAELVPTEEISRMLGLLRMANDIVIVDTPSVFNDNVLMLLESTDELLLIVTADIPAAKNVKIALQTLSLLKYPRQNIRLVLNQFERAPVNILEEIERELGMPLTMVIPRDPAVTVATNKAVPLVIDAPKSKSARSLSRLAGIVGAGVGIGYEEEKVA